MTAIRAEQTLHATPGDAVGWSWDFQDDDGQPFDFTGWTVEFIARDPDSGNVIIEATDATYDPPADGTVYVDLPATFTATLENLAPFTANPHRLAWALRLVAPDPADDEIPVGGELILSPSPYLPEEA